MITKRFYLTMSLCLAVAIPAEFILCRLLHIDGCLNRFTAGWYGMLLFAVIAAYGQWSSLPRLAAPFKITVLSILLWNALGLMPLFAARAAFPLADKPLAAIDASFGLTTGRFVHLVRQVHTLDMVSGTVYDATLWLVAAAVLLPTIFKREAAAQRFVVSIAACAVVTTILFCFLPAIGPWTVQGYAPSVPQAGVTETFQQLRAGLPVSLDTASVGIVSFPSFHCVLAILSAHALSSFRWLRWPVWILATLICASTITTGWHYGIDVVGGVMLAFAVAQAAKRTDPAQTCSRVRSIYA